MLDILRYDLRRELLDINGELEVGYQLKELFLDIISYAREQFLN